MKKLTFMLLLLMLVPLQYEKSRSITSDVGKKIQPGLSELIVNIHNQDYITEYFLPIFTDAASVIPAEYHNSTKVIIKGTAGMRLLPEVEQQLLWEQVQEGLNKHPENPFTILLEDLGTISGHLEAYYAVLSSNYIAGAIDANLKSVPGVPFVGALDMGGSSTQLIFYTGDEHERVISPDNFWSHSWLNFGVEKVREKVQQLIISRYPIENINIEDEDSKMAIDNPCTFPGYDEEILPGVILRGTGESFECVNLIREVVWPNQTCTSNNKSQPCYIDGIEHPPVRGHFYGMSVYFFAIDCVRELGSTYLHSWPNPTIDELEDAIHDFCKINWEDVKLNMLGRKHKYTMDYKLPHRCFEALYIALLLEDGFGFDGTHRNITIALEVQGKEVEWTLGYALAELLSDGFQLTIDPSNVNTELENIIEVESLRTVNINADNKFEIHNSDHNENSNSNEDEITVSAEEISKGCCKSDDDSIAFLFLTRGQMPLEEIWHEFFTWRSKPSYYSVYVHKHKDYSFPNESFFHGKEINSSIGKVKWATITQVRAIKALLQEALKDPLNEWFCLMSESCIPLITLPKWRYHLLNFDKSIVNACPLSINESELESRWKPELFDVGMKKEYWRKSATWFALLRKHAELFINDTTIEKGFENVPICDEHYLPSMLAYYHLDNETTCSDGFVHVIWYSQLAAHPLLHGPEEITPLTFERLRHPLYDKVGFGTKCSGVSNVCHFTARKFGYTSKFELLDHADLILSEEGYPYTGNPWDHHKESLRYDVIKSDNDKTFTEFYLLENNCRRPFLDNITAYYMHIDLKYATQISEVERIHNPICMAVPSHRDGQVIRQRKQYIIYYTKYGHRHAFPNANTFVKLGFDFENVTQLYEGDICRFPLGQPIPDLTKNEVAFNLSSWRL
eukprot:gene17505-23062_t